ncbi:hypothetical protein ACJU26_05395 [Acidithiobacillus sp. M4-SHS-6]|uniref:hypothetical protein n=1 Tax=Acidithiobacillus sp. M4-SHS-6 TaxID=3383024 RepID=UPI0039BEA8DC
MTTTIWDSQWDTDMDALKKRVDAHMRLHYQVSLDDLEIGDVPGYWQDKEPKIHAGHPLHGCLFCEGPFVATYTYFDHWKDRRGRFASPTRTWKALRERKHHG